MNRMGRNSEGPVGWARIRIRGLASVTVCLLTLGGCESSDFDGMRQALRRAADNVTGAFTKDPPKQVETTAPGPGQPETGVTDRPAEIGRMQPLEIETGLRDLMRIALDRTVPELSRQDGFYLSPDYQLRLPPGLLEMREALASVGLNQVADDLELRLNRAAELAVVDLKPLIQQKIAAVPIGDPRAVAEGLPDAATRHLEFNSAMSLLQEARPAVAGAMARAGALQMHEATVDLYRRTFPRQPVPEVELTDHVVQGTVGGLFIEMGRQEEAIRRTPGDRPSALLTRMFGGGGA